MKAALKIDRGLALMEKSFAVLLFMIILATVSARIFLRNVLNMGIPWLDEVFRMSTLWIIFFAASLVIRDGRHIKIEALLHFISDSKKIWLQRIKDIIGFSVCLMLSKASFVFFAMERQFSAPSSIPGLPGWFYALIFPIGFSIFALRFFIHFVLSFNGEKREQREKLTI